MTHAPDTLTLVADIGGTNTRVALARYGALLPGTVRRYANADHASLTEVLTRFLAAEDDVDCAAACVAVAGPVEDGAGRLTNLDWQIDSVTLAAAARAERVAILNDLQAQGFALGRLAPGSLRALVGTDHPVRGGAPQLVVGVGTGFNAAPVHHGPFGRIVVPSECGHISLPVRTESDFRLARHVERAHGFAGVEDVLSGRGLERLHAFLSAEMGGEAGLTAAEIMQRIAAGDDALAAKTGETFVRLLGNAVGDLALVHLPYGGLFLCGGVARAFAPHLGRFGFAEAFRDKGRFGPFMHAFPIWLIEDDYAALTGCAVHLASSPAG